MITLQITGVTIEEIYNQCAAVLQFPQHNVSVNITETAPAEKKAEPKAAKKEKATEPETTVSFKDVSELISKALPIVGKPKLIELLAHFGVKKGSEIKPEHYVSFIEAVNVAIKG